MFYFTFISIFTFSLFSTFLIDLYVDTVTAAAVTNDVVAKKLERAARFNIAPGNGVCFFCHLFYLYIYIYILIFS